MAEVPDRRPLGVGGGRLALLAAMDETEVDKAIERNAEWRERVQAWGGYTLS